MDQLSKEQFLFILEKFQEGTASKEELEFLDAYYNAFDLKDGFTASLNEHQRLQVRDELFDKLQNGISMAPKVNPAYRTWYVRFAAAAAVLLMLGAGWWFVNTRYRHAGGTRNLIAATSHIDPGKNRAVLTLANGKVIDLSDARTGVIISASKLAYTDGTLIQNNEASLFQTVTTPRAGQYQVVLPDGTRVWLNAASSLKFPSSFATASVRKVELSGEGYFEVAKDKRHPFMVKTERQEITVLGTHFNVTAYADEMTTKTTLLEGKVQVSKLQAKAGGADAKVLKPGEQTVLSSTAFDVLKTDTEEAVAWKNGYFRFNNENIVSIMRKLERWYNIEVRYEGTVSNEVFSGTASRFKSVGEVLEMLEYTNAVHFKVEGRRITVTK
uniref:FecR family protein n=1 Tax=Pedobacter schmidteae TaxID=2201271 RepID=UPI000EB3A7C9|nr:FecR family protein [Pedobacter schmidteae]